MSSFKRNDESPFRGPRVQTSRRLGLSAISLIVLALLIAACGSAAEPISAPAPTDTPVAETTITPSVTVADQEIVDSNVAIAEVVSDGPGWLVIHAQVDGKPGPILGYSPVADGTNADVMVEIDTANATETLYAMLHTDAGEVGTWEFPEGPDAPVKVGEQVVTPAFAITGGLAAAEEAVTPSVVVADQEIVDGKVTIAEAVSDGPGWLVIHAQADGKPGPILGYSAVASGANAALMVAIDAASVTETLYAMLHTDAGEVGVFEFPNGPDAPFTVGDQVVTPAFKVSKQAAASESALSSAGGDIAGAVVVTGDEAEVEMEDFKFNPEVLVIRPGTTVKFTNKDRAQHTATSDTGVFDSGYLSKGEEYYFTFTEPGTYPYYCIPHGGPGGQGMAATIIVEP